MKSRFAASVLVAALVSVGAAGCAFVTPQATTNIVESADGVNGDISPDIAVRNATLISNDDKSASLLVSIVNKGATDNQVVIQYKNASGTPVTETAYVQAGSTVSFGAAEGKKITLSDLDVRAGELFPVFFQYGQQTGVELQVPVLTSDWEQYEGLVPTPTPSVLPLEPTGTPTPTPTATAAP